MEKMVAAGARPNLKRIFNALDCGIGNRFENALFIHACCVYTLVEFRRSAIAELICDIDHESYTSFRFQIGGELLNGFVRRPKRRQC